MTSVSQSELCQPKLRSRRHLHPTCSLLLREYPINMFPLGYSVIYTQINVLTFINVIRNEPNQNYGPNPQSTEMYIKTERLLVRVVSNL